MKPSHPLFSISAKATEAIVAFRFVGGNGGAQAGENDNTLGVAEGAAATGETYSVATLGTVALEAGAAVAEGDRVAADADGRAVPVNGVTYTVAAAVALEGASGAGKYFEAHLIPN